MDTSKIIKGVVSGRNFTTTAPIIKENYGIYLQIEGVELPETYQVDFSNEEHHGTSVTMIGNADGVRIPRQFIDTGKDIFAFLYWVGEDYGKTVYKFRIPNKVRPDRTSETPTPEEQSVIDQAISALNSAVTATAQDVIDADASAQASAESARASANSAVQASLSESNAERAKGNAQASAESASASATASAQSASEAETARQATTSLVAEAQRYANASEQSATASANSAEQAESAKGVAQSYAQDAQTSATYASLSESTASTKASEASTSAQTASNKATEASQSASQASGYAQTAETAKTDAQTAQGKAEDAQTAAETAQGLAENARDEAQNLVDGISGKVEQIDSNTERIESLEDDRYKPYVTDSAFGSIASFSDGADDIPLKSLIVNINPVQDLHGYDSPWVGGGGKNLLDTSTLLNGAYSDAQFNIPSSSSTVYRSIKISLKAGTYTLSASVSIDVVRTLVDGGFDSTTYGNKTSHTFTTTTDGYVGLTIRRYDINDWDDATKLQIESGSTATDWTPYENICPITGHTGFNLYKTGGNLITKEFPEDAFLGTFSTDSSSISSASIAHCYCVYVGKNTNVRYYKEVTTQQALALAFTDEYVTDRTGVTIYGAINMANRSNSVQNSGEHPYLIIQMTDATMRGTGFESRKARLFFELGMPFSPRGTIDKYSYDWTEEVGTVYGCVLDVLTGVLKITQVAIDLSALSWTTRYTGTLQKAISTTLPYYYTRADATSFIAERYVCDTIAGVSNLSSPDNTDVGIYAYSNSNSAHAATLYAVIDVNDETPIGLAVYTVEEPIEIQLEPHELVSILGGNQIWTDNGTIDVEYRADTRLYIEKLTQPEEDDMIADSAISEGQFFMIGNSLYRALANIASGATITVGTNAQRVSLSDALNLVNA